MKNEEFFQMLDGIEDKYIEKASEMLALQQEAREAVIVHAAPKSRGSIWKTVIASAAATAAAVFGLFVLMSIVKNGSFPYHGDPVDPGQVGASSAHGSPIKPDQSGSSFLYSSEGRTFTKDFDGLVLTVTTDKTEYNIGDTIHLTATLENNRDEEVYLYYGNSPIDYTVELSPRFEDLIEYPHEIVSRDAAITRVIVNQGEKYVQDFTFLTYTDYIESVSEIGNIEYYPDYSKPAALGAHYGQLRILTCTDKKWNDDEITEYVLEFAVTVNGESSESESKGQTFTKDFDGLVLTVTTDKSTYYIGQPIELTATLENNTGKDITLYYGTCGMYGYDGQKAGTTAELLPRFEHLIEYPIRSAVWFDEAITEIPFGQGELCFQKFTFQTYTGYKEIDDPPPTGEFMDAVFPDFSKAAAPGVYYGRFTVMFYSDGEARDHITDCTLDFSVTLTDF